MKTQKRMKITFKLTVIVWLVQAGCLGVVKEAIAQKPNVIIVLTDDQGYGDLSSHGNPIINTPNLDKLYSESIRFTDFHVAPMCTPTRGELMTGQHAFRNGAVFVTQGKSHIHRGIPTMADVFSSNGYATGHFGKWHLGDNYPYRPQDRGFQETVHHGAWGVTSMVDYWSNNYFDDTYFHNNQWEQYKGYCTNVWFDEAMGWMKKQSQAGKPFFTYLATNVPHMPLVVADAYQQPYKDDVSPAEASFYGMITHFDENLGRLEAFLVENGLKDNTILIFMTDNGTADGEKIFNAGMRGKKRSYYDGGHRVPLFIRWPAQGLDTPRDLEVLSHSTDLLPTLISLVGLKKSKAMNFDGINLAEVIRGDEDQLPDRKIVIQYEKLDRNASAVLWNQWRLVNNEELYDMKQDPGQQHNIADKHPDVLAEMSAHYQHWYEEMLPLENQIDYISIGSEDEPETSLSSANWIGDYADSWWNVEKDPARFGYWDLQVASTGVYEIALHRWPKEAKRSLDEDMTLSHIDGARINRKVTMKALPVSKAKLSLNSEVVVKNTSSGDRCAVFEVQMKQGEQVRLEPMLLDKEGKALCGAYFTYVKKK